MMRGIREDQRKGGSEEGRIRGRVRGRQCERKRG